MQFYRDLISTLNESFGGIHELEAAAAQFHSHDGMQKLRSSGSPENQKNAIGLCHLALVYLGDLSRYRASEKLDKQPDFRPAIGYYDLAYTVLPSSGVGYHQRAVVALEQKRHLTAIYYLYRAIVACEPHPLASKNIQLEFNKTNLAWERGELIAKGPPNDPESSLRTLEGWFVRFHSICCKEGDFRGHIELEREVLGQLSSTLKQRDIGMTLVRMVLVNMSAQHHATDSSRGKWIPL